MSDKNEQPYMSGVVTSGFRFTQIPQEESPKEEDIEPTEEELARVRSLLEDDEDGISGPLPPALFPLGLRPFD